MTRHGAALALLLAAALPALALDKTRPLTDFGVYSWEDELPQNTVNTIAQTPDGAIWAGTYQGLVRFDGARFTTFSRDRTPGLTGDRILALAVGRDGTLFIGTSVGLFRQNGGVFRRVATRQGPSAMTIDALSVDGSGTLWLGGVDGLFRVSDGLIEAVSGEGLPRSPVRTLVTGRKGDTWIATDAGLVHHEAGRFTTHRPVPGELAGANRTRGLALDLDGGLWVGTEQGPVPFRDGTFGPPVQDLPRRLPLVLTVDRSGALWVAIEAGGLARFVSGAVSRLRTGQGLTSNRVTSFHEDHEGSLWVGTNGGGLVCVRDEKMATYTTFHGLSGNNVRTVSQDLDGTLWIGTEGNGLSCRKDGVFTAVPLPSGSSADYVRAVLSDREGRTWVGTSGAGLEVLRNGPLRTITTKDGLLSDAINALYQTRDGSIWVGHYYGGLSRIRDASIERFPPESLPAGARVLSLFEDRSGRLWVGTMGQGTFRFEEGRASLLSVREGLPSNSAFCFLEEGDGTLWIGTGEGLVRYRDGRLGTVSVKDGLLDPTIFALLPDDREWIWMTSNRGLSRVTLESLRNVADGRGGRLTVESFGKGDGMRTNQCNGATQPSAFRGRDGRLWIPTVKGLTAVDPARPKKNPVPPPVSVEELLVDGRPLSQEMTIRSGNERYEIRYTAFSFLAPERVRFRYTLEGYDPAWTDAAGRERVAIYTGLPPGSYTFRVTACNGDGVWNETGASVSFRLLPPSWKTPWAYALYGFAAFALVFGVVRARLAGLRRANERLEERIGERTRELLDSERRAKEASLAKSAFLAHMSHELRTPLNAILGFVQLMERDAGRGPKDREALSIITRSGQHLLALINDVLSISKIEAGQVTLNATDFDLRLLLLDLTSLFAQRARTRNLLLTSTLDDRLPSHVNGDEGKLREVLTNLLGNSVKYTDRGSVRLLVDVLPSSAIRFAVADTGRGIAQDEVGKLFLAFSQTESGRGASEGTGLGLAISQRFVKLMGGELTVTSERGKGSTFAFEIPLPRAASAVSTASRRRVVGIAPEAGSMRVYTILVVDDVPENRLLLSRLLEAAGFAILEARDGREAVDAWAASRPDLVFMDVHMPVLDGIEATREIRGREGGTSHVPILAITASAFEQERGPVLDAGCDDLVTKPFREEVIFDRIASHLPVTYLYQEDPEAPPETSPAAATAEVLSTSRLSGIPEELRSRIHAAAQGGDQSQAYAALAELSTIDPALADALYTLVKAYRFDELLSSLEEASP